MEKLKKWNDPRFDSLRINVIMDEALFITNISDVEFRSVSSCNSILETQKYLYYQIFGEVTEEKLANDVRFIAFFGFESSIENLISFLNRNCNFRISEYYSFVTQEKSVLIVEGIAFYSGKVADLETLEYLGKKLDFVLSRQELKRFVQHALLSRHIERVIIERNELSVSKSLSESL